MLHDPWYILVLPWATVHFAMLLSKNQPKYRKLWIRPFLNWQNFLFYLLKYEVLSYLNGG